MSSNYLQQVTAVIDTTSTFGTTLKQLKDNVTALQTQMSTLLADAPGTLDTLNEIAGAINDDPAFFSSMATANTTLQTNIDNLTAAAATARTALQTALQATHSLIWLQHSSAVVKITRKVCFLYSPLHQLALFAKLASECQCLYGRQLGSFAKEPY